MSTVENIREKQEIALGREREAALSVIIRRVLGALKYEGRVVPDYGGKRSMEARTGNFWIRLMPEPHSVHFSVRHRRYRYVMSGRLYSDGGGDWLDGRVNVLSWKRSADCCAWQAELFETFHQDDDWLLSIPQKVMRPEIVTEVLSHIASLSAPTA